MIVISGKYTHLGWIAPVDLKMGRTVFYATIIVGCFYGYFEPSFFHETVLGNISI
jgi:hypothetical protein